MRVYALLGVAAALTVGACGASRPEKTVDLAAEETAVRGLNAGLNDAIQRKDLDAIATAYAPGAALLWQNDPRLSGPQIREAWAQAFRTPGFALRLHSTHILVAEAGDLALDEGTLELELPGPKGAVAAPGKYLVAWQKTANGWKILYDVYNTDAAAAPAPATAKAE